MASAQNPDSLTFAVLGNSISTYYDYLPSGYAVYYSQDREKNHGFQVGDTWWMQLSRISGLTFLANASWSGSRVAADVLNSNAPFLSNHRVKAIGRAGKPDFIFIAGGTNDWNVAKVPLGEYRTSNFTDSVSFRGAYQRLLWKLTTWYPETRVICLSIFPRENGVNDKNAQGWSQADANASIKYIAQQFGQYYIDCTSVPWSSNWGASTFDKLHPTAYGGTQLANHIYNSLISQKIITRALKRSGEVEEAERLLDLSFTADGIVNQGTCESRVGRHGSAAVFYDASTDTYLGCTKARASDYFYATYDIDTPLANTFQSGNVTWEMLVRLDSEGDHSATINRTCILGNEQDGGWAFYNSELASSFCYWNKSGVKSTMKSITGDSILIAGKFYHLVATMDRLSHIMRYYVNGKLVCTGTRAGTDMVLPQCGTSKGRKGMWICLGGDASAGSYGGGAENSAACSFVFARIYDGALSQKAALKLYSDEVKRFTEPQASLGTELLLDCEFTPDGAVNHAPSFLDKPIETMGEVPISYNADINLYEAQFNKTKAQFFKYFMGDPATLSQLSDAYSVEVFCRNSSALPTATNRPIGMVNGYGFGLSMNTKGNVSYATTTMGNKADGTYAKTQFTSTEDGLLTDQYTHYVIVYDRKHYRSLFYVDGTLAASRWLTFKECPVYEWTPSTWLAIGGDAYGSYEQTSYVGSYPFMGDIAMVRVYGKALSPNDVTTLAGILQEPERSYTMGSNGYVAVCLPYVWKVPEGCTAFIVTEVASPSVILTPIAQAGEYVPYGTPVILKGEAKATVTLRAENKEEVTEMVNGTPRLQSRLGAKASEKLSNGNWINLLAGTYTGRSLAVGEGYYLKQTGANIYRVTTATTLPPFSCYMPSADKRTYFKIEESADGLETIQDPQMVNGKLLNGKCFDLSGRQISTGSGASHQKGIVIKGNKKVLMK